MDKSKQWESILAIVMGLIFLHWVRRSEGWLMAAFAIGMVSILVPAAAAGIHWLWNRLALLMGEVSGRLLLTLAYILVLMPMAIVARLAGRSGIRRKTGGVTYFTERNHRYIKEDLEHPW